MLNYPSCKLNCLAEALQSISYKGYVLVTMGDKYIEDDALGAIVDGYVKQRADMAMLTIPKTQFTEVSLGRVFVAEDGQALDIVEKNGCGCIMVLARHESVPALRRALTQDYYRPRGLNPAALPCVAVEGAGLAEF